MIRAARGVAAATALGLVLTGGSVAAQKAGGTLRIYNPDSPPGLNIYEQATPFGQGPLMAVYNNLVLFDQHNQQIRLESIKPVGAVKREASTTLNDPDIAHSSEICCKPVC